MLDYEILELTWVNNIILHDPSLDASFCHYIVLFWFLLFLKNECASCSPHLRLVLHC